MCSIYDNLRKGLGNVSKDRCISYIIHGFAVKVAESHIVTTF